MLVGLYSAQDAEAEILRGVWEKLEMGDDLCGGSRRLIS
jgi:hypothetical protein